MRLATAFLAVVVSAWCSYAAAADTSERAFGVGIEVGTGLSRNASDTHLLRLNARYRPAAASADERNGSKWGLWWDVSLAAWRYEKGHDKRHLIDVGLTPVLRYSLQGQRGFFIEGGWAPII